MALAVVVVTGVTIGYRLWNKPHEDIKDASAIKINAIALYNTLANDSLHKSTTFINKVVEVSGKVKQVSENQQKQKVILLETNVSDGSVNCTMEENVKSVKAGDSILLKGICMGYAGGDKNIGLSGDVFLIRCYHSF